MADKERVGRFLRAVLGLMTVATTLVALVSPPSMLVFFGLLVPTWVFAGAGAAWLVYRDGWSVLERSFLFAPRTTTSTATVLFIGVTVLMKVAGTVGANWLLGEGQVGYTVGVTTSVLALLVGYAFAFWASESLRTLLGVLTVASVVPGAFLVALGPAALVLAVVGWLGSPGVTVWLIHFGGYERLRASRLYRPDAPASQATAAFAGLLGSLVALGTIVLAQVMATRIVPTLPALAVAVAALAASYWLVFRVGVVGTSRAWYYEGADGSEDDGSEDDGGG